MNFRVPKKIPVERSSLSIRVESISVRDKVGTLWGEFSWLGGSPKEYFLFNHRRDLKFKDLIDRFMRYISLESVKIPRTISKINQIFNKVYESGIKVDMINRRVKLSMVGIQWSFQIKISEWIWIEYTTPLRIRGLHLIILVQIQLDELVKDISSCKKDFPLNYLALIETKGYPCL